MAASTTGLKMQSPKAVIAKRKGKKKGKAGKRTQFGGVVGGVTRGTGGTGAGATTLRKR